MRELQNRVKRAVIMADSSRTTASALALASEASPSTILREARESIEREMMQQALKGYLGRISLAAVEPGISWPPLYELAEKVGMSPD